MSTTISKFCIHGVNLSVHSSSVAISSAVSHHLQYFRQEAFTSPDSLSICFEAVPSPEAIPFTPSSTGRRLFSRPRKEHKRPNWVEWPCEVYQDQKQLVINFFSHGLLLINGSTGKGHGYIVNPESRHQDFCVRYIHMALVELLKWKKLYTIHATALEKHGSGVLIPGVSGQGKTTTFLSLLRSGYRCLSDDHPFIYEEGNAIKVLAFPVKVDVTENTINLFPELQDRSTSLHQGIVKRYFYVEDLYPGSTGHSCIPKVLLFPQVVDQATSWLEPISKSQALEDLLPHGLLVYDREVAKREFQTLTHLVQQVECYRLQFGRDVLDVPRLIDPLLEKTNK